MILWCSFASLCPPEVWLFHTQDLNCPLKVGLKQHTFLSEPKFHIWLVLFIKFIYKSYNNFRRVWLMLYYTPLGIHVDFLSGLRRLQLLFSDTLWTRTQNFHVLTAQWLFVSSSCGSFSHPPHGENKLVFQLHKMREPSVNCSKRVAECRYYYSTLILEILWAFEEKNAKYVVRSFSSWS